MLQGTQPPRLDRDALSEDHQGALLARIGTVVGGGVCAAVAASVPAEMRMGDGGSTSRALDQWLALAALALPIGILAVGVLRRARVGLRILAGGHATVLAACAVWWAVVEVGVLSALGALLRAKTHHHGLAGVTFAILGLASAFLVTLLAARAGRALARTEETTRRVALYVGAGAAFALLLLVGLRTARADGTHTASSLVDGLAIVVASAIASARPVARARGLAVAGVPVAAAVLGLGLATLRGQPSLGEAIAQLAPVHGWILGLFSR